VTYHHIFRCKKLRTNQRLLKYESNKLPFFRNPFPFPCFPSAMCTNTFTEFYSMFYYSVHYRNSGVTKNRSLHQYHVLIMITDIFSLLHREGPIITWLTESWNIEHGKHLWILLLHTLVQRPKTWHHQTSHRVAEVHLEDPMTGHHTPKGAETHCLLYTPAGVTI